MDIPDLAHIKSCIDNITRLWVNQNKLIKIRLTLGSVSKIWAKYVITTTKIQTDIILVSCVRPPTDCWITLRDNDAAKGKHEKHDPIRFPAP